MTPLDVSSMYSIKGIAILDQDGNRVLSKYYDTDIFSTEADRLSFEKTLFQKTCKSNSEILLLNGLVCVYRSNVDLFFYVIGDCAENELMLLNMLNSVYDSFSALLKKNVEKKAVLDNLDNALLIFDELCDDGVIFGDGVARNCPAVSA